MLAYLKLAFLSSKIYRWSFCLEKILKVTSLNLVETAKNFNDTFSGQGWGVGVLMRCLHVNTEQCAAAGAGTRYNGVADEDSATPSLNGDTAHGCIHTI